MRNVITSKINSNFNQFKSESPMGTQFKIDAQTINSLSGNVITPGKDISSDAYNNFLLGEYKVDAEAQLNVRGMGFGYGLTDKLMFYGEIAYYEAQVRSSIKRTQGNSYESTARLLDGRNQAVADNLRQMIDANENTVQSVIVNHYGYKPIGDWYGKGYGDMETGLMYKALDRGVYGLMVYPGVVLPTGRQDDPDILQDIAFGDGQFDLFTELATGYVVDDHLQFGATIRYTHQFETTKKLRIPDSQDFALSSRTGTFNVKYGDKLNLMLNSTYKFNDWISFTPVYRYMRQESAQYHSDFHQADSFLSANSDKEEHQGQMTASISSITPFLKKQFVLPAQININYVKTLSGKNIPNVQRFEFEIRMLF